MTFKRFAEYLGLEVETDSYGFGYTNPSVTERVEGELKPDISKTSLRRRVRLGAAAKIKGGSWRCSEECAAVYTKTNKKPFGGTCSHCGEEYTQET